MKPTLTIKAFSKSLTREKIKDTGILVAIVLNILGIWSNNTQLFYYTIPILFITMLVPNLFFPVAFILYGLSNIIGKVLQQIILSALFFLMITPIAILRKAMKKDVLKLHAFKKSNNSTFIDREHEYSSKDFEKPF